MVDDDVQLSLDRLDITNDSNGDGLLSPGESARISYMVFRNAGDSDILDLTGFVSSSSPYVSFTSLNLSLSAGVCYSGGTCSESDDFLFDVSLSTPVGTSITIDIDLSDQFNNSYYLSYDLQVQ